MLTAALRAGGRMRVRATFLAGFASGYVLGARAGRERYEAIMKSIRGIKDDPSWQETAGVVQAQAAGLAAAVTRAVGERLPGRRSAGPEAPLDPSSLSPYSANGSRSGGHSRR